MWPDGICARLSPLSVHSQQLANTYRETFMFSGKKKSHSAVNCSSNGKVTQLMINEVIKNVRPWLSARGGRHQRRNQTGRQRRMKATAEASVFSGLVEQRPSLGGAWTLSPQRSRR